MRRAYIEAHMPLDESYRTAAQWAGRIGALIGPSTRAIEASPWLERMGIPLGVVGHRHTRFTARPQGTVMAWCLNVGEIMDLERRNNIDGVVAVRATNSFRPWVTAHDADHLGGQPLDAVAEARPAIKALVDGITGIATVNQGLVDPRERSAAVQGLTYFRQRGIQLVPEQLIVEAIRNDWPGDSPLELARLAGEINRGKRLRYQQRIRPEVMAEWAQLE
ncbi:hypothetical protein [uncultured Serinicoccus sp.]|uniref:hypothetical protein n=1 Tax=uncultured Serinicoccus sp. TaxID=735514 RepID=UPI0026249312|nr:hypothetical protein [uncultured Serinicoccus sp.]